MRDRLTEVAHNRADARAGSAYPADEGRRSTPTPLGRTAVPGIGPGGCDMQPMTTRFVDWVDLVIELVHQPRADFPRSALARHLAATFHSTVSWNWLAADGSFRYELDRPLPGYAAPREVDDLARVTVPHHPLIRWYGVTRSAAPTSLHQVPRGLESTSWLTARERLTSLGRERQLAIPYRFDRCAIGTFVMARGGRDYDDVELDLARQIQPLLTMLDRQADVVGRTPAEPAAAWGLTGREVAVLQLLADGLTARAIGHRLLISERTIHAHLRSIYRKLGVADRMRAVLAAGELGFTRDAPAGEKDGLPLPGPSGLLHDLRWPNPDELWAVQS